MSLYGRMSLSYQISVSHVSRLGHTLPRTAALLLPNTFVSTLHSFLLLLYVLDYLALRWRTRKLRGHITLLTPLHS